ncbi:MAG: L-histidine N(alpha)-methyltransferase [Gammaproteobacteria bacterium]|nr:L-histidine N(alpha)-methyltransferase [Gammaproteobacteria bacterium]
MNQVLATTELNTVFEECLILKQELIDGLCAKEKYINPKFFYDEVGSQLFEQIMQLPEYYPSRIEMSLLEKYKHEIAEVLGENIVLIEPGAGNCEKVQYILQTLKPKCYMPIDISADFLFDCARKLQNKYPFINIHAVADDMKAKVEIPSAFKNNEKIVFYPGSTIGNYNPNEALAFLKHVKDLVGKGGGLLVGVDLQKEKEVLDAAYNDKHGITALFNLNVLNHANKLLGSDIDIDLFEHVAFYNEEQCRIEMHLESKAEHKYNIDNVSQLCFSEFERIHTEYSYKYTIESFSELAEQAGLKLEKYWIDDDKLFSVQYYKVS